MGIIPKRSAEDQAAYELSLSRGFGDTTHHLNAIKAVQGPVARQNYQATLTHEDGDKAFGTGPIAMALAGKPALG